MPGISPEFLGVLDQVARDLDMVSISPDRNPAQNFETNAKGLPWFVKAEMVRPLGGRRVNGRTAQRELRLEVTVKRGGEEAAEKLAERMGVDVVIREERRMHTGGRLHGRR